MSKFVKKAVPANQKQYFLYDGDTISCYTKQELDKRLKEAIDDDEYTDNFTVIDCKTVKKYNVKLEKKIKLVINNE